jgi:hypothetical protein
MPILAKFQCVYVTRDKYEEETVKLRAVIGAKGSAAAKKWSKGHRWASIYITISDPPKRGFFKPRGFYYFEVTEEGSASVSGLPKEAKP